MVTRDRSNDWSAALNVASRFFEREEFDQAERDYKLRIAAAVEQARIAFIEGEDWWENLRAAVKHPENNLVAWRVADDFLAFVAEEPDRAEEALRCVWGEGDLEGRIRRFEGSGVDAYLKGTGAVLSIASLLLLGLDGEVNPIYRATPVATIRRALGLEVPKQADSATQYIEYVAALDEFLDTARQSGLALRDRLDAQSVLYCIAQWDPPEDWTTDERLELAALRQGGDMPAHLSLTKAVEEWDPSTVADQLELAAEERTAFLGHFPADCWADLPIERYALGLEDPDVFSRWIEFGTPHLGSIKGGSAMKHLVFKRAHKPGWYFEQKYSDHLEAWTAVREGFEELVDLASQGDFIEIDAIEALWAAPAVRTKTAWIYFPDQVLPIYSTAHLDYWLKIFGIDAASSAGPVQKNRSLFEMLTGLPEFEGWQPLEIMYFLYSWSSPDLSRTILKIAPGEGARLWEDCLANGYVRVGWDDLGDLTRYEGQDDLREAVQAFWPESSKTQTTKTSRSLAQFAELEQGDLIVANRGKSAVVGIGRVVDGYRYRDDLAEFRHTVDVDWFDTIERRVDFGSAWMPTIVKVRPDQYHQIIHEGDEASDAAGDSGLPLPSVPPLHLEAEKLLERQGQLVFYGPPGTGKTYSARRHAVWLLAGGSRIPEAAHAFGPQFAALEAAYSAPQVSDERPSWLLVANPQRWAWQELIDDGSVDYDYGRLQRNYREAMPGDEVFGYEATPVKRVVATASVTRGLDPASEHAGIVVGDGRLINGPSWDDLQHDAVLGQSEPLGQRMQGTMFRLEPAEAARLRELCGGETTGAGPSDVPQLTRVTFHPTYSYEDFIEGYKPTESGHGGLELQMRSGIFRRVCRAAAADPDNPYVVLIDEINRGNVPKILGELITLIEKDKRGVTVSLPQSGEAFQVPENVHVIATMNTADRSIHVLDAALRRRFAFLELLPEPAVLEGTSIGSAPLDELLAGLNSLIRQHVGREKQVGHAVLMNGDRPITSLTDFQLAFRYELLPLLQEYTYGDYRDLALLLGEEIIDTEAEVPRDEILEEPALLVQALAAHLESAQ